MTTPTNPLELSDEDFLQLNSPPPIETPVVAEEPSTEEVITEEPVAEDAPEEVEVEEAVESEPTVEDKAAPIKEAAPATSSATTVNYEDSYKKIMAPFKANGKMIELKSEEEAIQLMQMGANYTRKMQDIQPHRKTLLMLENNGLLDPDRLSFLIDLDKGNPEAITKLLKDHGIDPLGIDTDQDSTYLVGNHKVTDDEAAFRNQLDELSSNPEGQETLRTINSTWDQASKEVLWNDPNVMGIIHTQRENGIYSLISSEIERRRILGQIPPNTPFIHAYKAVGDEMAANNQLGVTTQSAANSPVARRVATPKPAVANGDKASAAATTRSTSKPATTVVNPLAMSDDDFMKQMQNRL